MKKIFFAVVALAAMSSCSKDQTVAEAPQQEIQFGNVFVDNATRADYSDGLELTTFDLFGTVTGTEGTINIFDGTDVYKTKRENDDIGTEGSTWWYDAADAQYWIPGASYNFVAVAGATIWSDEQDSNKMPRLLHTKGSSSGSNIADMLYATATATVNEEGIPSVNPVNFTFSHLLSKAHFTVTSNAENGYYHKVTGITIANYSAGTYTIADDAWAGTTAKDVAFANIANVTKATGAQSNADMLLVPTAASYKVTFTVELWNGKGTDDTADDVKYGTEPKTIEVENDLVKGNAYNFTIACSVGKPIEFNVANDPTWNTQPDVAIQ